MKRYKSLKEDTIRAERRNNLTVILGVDSDDYGNYYKVVLYNNDNDKTIWEFKYRDESTAEETFNKILRAT